MIGDTESMRAIKSKKYLDWLVEFTDNTFDKSWDDETAHLRKLSRATQYDWDNIQLFSSFLEYMEDLARKQYVVSLPHHKSLMFRYNIKLRGNFYEVTRLSNCIATFKKIDSPEGKPIYIDEPIDPKELKDREFIQYILVNKDLNITDSALSVHIAHACTICAIREGKKPAFDVWYNNNQKIVILDASQEKMEQMEPVSYGIRDTGHNDIPKNALVAISLGIIPKAKALTLTEGCTLHKGKS